MEEAIVVVIVAIHLVVAKMLFYMIFLFERREIICQKIEDVDVVSVSVMTAAG